MPDLLPNTVSPPEPVRRRRVVTLRRRLEGLALGALSGGAAGWLAVLVGDIHGTWHWWIIAGLAALAAALGYRFGRGVVAATLVSLIESAP